MVHVGKVLSRGSIFYEQDVLKPIKSRTGYFLLEFVQSDGVTCCTHSVLSEYYTVHIDQKEFNIIFITVTSLRNTLNNCVNESY
jgi:hypothetical protein